MARLKEKLYKPKDFGLALDIHPTKITKLARDIEEKNLYHFNKTVLGSYVFKKEDFRIIKDYHDMLTFFQIKQTALQKLEEKMHLHQLREHQKKPAWFRYLVRYRTQG